MRVSPVVRAEDRVAVPDGLIGEGVDPLDPALRADVVEEE
jgi:hypothetical protein